MATAMDLSGWLMACSVEAKTCCPPKPLCPAGHAGQGWGGQWPGTSREEWEGPEGDWVQVEA